METMATDDCFPASWVCEHENAFYFEVSEESEVDGDAFGKSDQCDSFLISSKGKFLLLDEGQFQGHFISIHQKSQPESKCNIQIYHSKEKDRMEGIPVMLFFIKDDKKMVACCNNLNNVYPEVMNPPSDIPEDAHKAVFYLESLSSGCNKYMFQSSLFPSQYLGFKSDEQTSLQKLVLLKIKGKVCESCEFTLIR